MQGENLNDDVKVVLTDITPLNGRSPVTVVTLVVATFVSVERYTVITLMSLGRLDGWSRRI
jgi:hypothetical protein